MQFEKETVIGKGYRFVGDVELIRAPGSQQESFQEEVRPTVSPMPLHFRGIISAVTVALLGLIL